MAIEDFARVFFTMGRLLDRAAEEVGLNRKEAMLVSVVRSTSDETVSTSQLVQIFRRWCVSSPASAAKDVSVAKSELFRKDLLVARRELKRVALTDRGEEIADTLASKISQLLSTEFEIDRTDITIISGLLGPVSAPIPSGSAARPRPKPPARDTTTRGSVTRSKRKTG